MDEQIHEDQWRAFEKWPKVDLHRHLPGAIPFDSWWRIVHEKGVALPSRDPQVLREMVTISGTADLKTFLKCFDVIDLMYVDAETIEELTYIAIADAARENVIYLELRYSPTRMAQSAGISTAEALEATIAGKQRALADYDIAVSLIAGLSREMGVAQCAAEAEIIAGYAGRGIDGIDLLGNEIDYPAHWFEPIFQPLARDGRLGITVHAGESSPASSVRDAILHLGATRIGHGVRAEQEPGVLDLLRERGVTLEMCPTSNVQTQATPAYTTHPLPRYLRTGIKVTVNTDDPSVSQIDLAHEYAVATSIMGLSEAELIQTLFDAIDAAFTSEATKAQLRRKLEAFVVNHQREGKE